MNSGIVVLFRLSLTGAHQPIIVPLDCAPSRVHRTLFVRSRVATTTAFASATSLPRPFVLLKFANHEP